MTVKYDDEAADLLAKLCARAARAPFDALIGITEADVAVLLSGCSPWPQEWPWQPPSRARTTFYGHDCIVIDRPPMFAPKGHA